MIIQRNLYTEIQPYLRSKQAIVITGMRRVGKTTLLKSIFDATTSANKLFLDLENIVDQSLFAEEDYEQIKASFQGKGIDFSKKVYLFLDEIQYVKNIPSVVKYLGDHNDIKFFLTGSASFYLKNVFSESLAGRKYIFELYPFLFDEFLQLKGSAFKVPRARTGVTRPVYTQLKGLYEEYIQFGGFPEVIKTARTEEKGKVLEDIISSYVQLEVRGLSDFRKGDVIQDLIFFLAGQVGQKLDVLKLSSLMGVARQTMEEYLSFLEGTYLITRIKPYAKSRAVEIRKVRKMYFCDSGLVNHLSRVSIGAAFEQAVFQSLQPKGAVQYYQKKSGAEIDFIIDKKRAYEVKTTPREHDAKRLRALSAEIGMKSRALVSKEYTPVKDVIYGFQL